MSFANANTLINNSVFKEYCLFAFVKKSRDVIAAHQVDPNSITPNAISLAWQITRSTSAFRDQLAYAVVGDSRIYASATLPTDATLVAVVNDIWPVLAGPTPFVTA